MESTGEERKMHRSFFRKVRIVRVTLLRLHFPSLCQIYLLRLIARKMG